MKQHRFPRKAWILAGITAMALPASLWPSMAYAQQPHSGAMTKAMPGMAGSAGTGQLHPLKEKRVMTVTGSEDWDALRGFGKDSGMVAMMTLMMVGGSGMEHMKMKMGPMKAGGMEMAEMNSPAATNQPGGLSFAASISPNPPVVGDNTLLVAVTDAQGKPVTGLKLSASVAMTSMDMGTAHPQAVESPAGRYPVTVNFSMNGPWRVILTGAPANGGKAGVVRTALDFNVGNKEKWAQTATGTQSSGPRVVMNTPSNAVKVGKNPLEFTILDAAGKPVAGAKVTTAVAMTSMDMGTAHPQAKEGKEGRYTTEVEFSMAGPWRITMSVASANQKSFTRAFDFNVKE